MFVSQPQEDHAIEIRNLRAGGPSAASRWLTEDIDQLFPLIDRFGQYRHADWPGKIASEADLRQRVSQESRPNWRSIPDRRTGTSTAAGCAVRNWKRPVTSGSQSTRGNGG